LPQSKFIDSLPANIDYESGIDSGQVYQEHKYKVINDISREKKLGRNVLLESSLHCMKDLMASTFYYSESCSYIRISNEKSCIY